MLYPLLKPLLFALPPERAHHLTVTGLRTVLHIPGIGGFLRAEYGRPRNEHLRRTVFGLDFPNPIGLAAGFDKDGKYYHDMAALGFGFLELGTVTPRPQGGNPRPRLFRLHADEALINRMGFNNEGVDALAQRLMERGRPGDCIVGGNIGKNKDTPNEEALNDYRYCFERLFDHVDYFVVNVSSPNTLNLRDLQEREPLTRLLAALQENNHRRTAPKPILLKIAPDLTDGQLDDILAIRRDTGIAGLIATNTTVDRSGLTTPAAAVAALGMGGLSGAPLRNRATAVIRYLSERGGTDLDIIGVGGICDGPAAAEKIAAGAKLVQVYSGLIYRGPGLIGEIKRELLTA